MSTLTGIRTIRELPIEQKRLFVRVDYNVPLEGGVITDDSRIRESLPTLRHALERGARLVLASHLGRPKPGKTEGLSLEPVGARLAELLKVEVLMPESCIGDSAKKAVFDLREGQVCLLENLRFEEGEEKNDENFAVELRKLADMYVDDAFGAVHRAHASVHALPKLFQERGCGFLLEKEIAALGKLMTDVERPYVAILGGAKVSDKLAVLESLIERVDVLLIGGAMANTFLAARGVDMKASRVEADKLALARTILSKAEARKVKVVLPADVVVAASLDADSGTIKDVSALGLGDMALDVGPKTVDLFRQAIANAKSVFWNGPLGLFEKAPFSSGTFETARALADASAFTVVGGGDSAAAVYAAGGDLASKMKHISTGGGASLELIEGKKLPGIEVLRSGGN
ncbi:MAG: phosphoglycerate kinase [Polyangiaceae bacterium]|nr:phosphoglycerate kinase [Polyangiaceae bacterium]